MHATASQKLNCTASATAEACSLSYAVGYAVERPAISVCPGMGSSIIYFHRGGHWRGTWHYVCSTIISLRLYSLMPDEFRADRLKHCWLISLSSVCYFFLLIFSPLSSTLSSYLLRLLPPILLLVFFERNITARVSVC